MSAGGLLLAMTTPASASPAPAGASPRRHPDPTTPDLVIAQAAAGRRYHFPGATKLSDGTILVVARDGVSHSDPTGRLHLVRSTDNAATWSEPVTIWDSLGDDRDPKISVTASGRVFVQWFTSSVAGSPPGVVSGVFVMSSDDGGLTWSTPTIVGTSMEWIAEHGRVTEMPDGTLLSPVYGPGGRSAIVRSTDGGLTFPAENEYIFDTGGVGTNEVTLTVLPDGQVTAWLRPNAQGAPSLLLRSFDSGYSWSSPEFSDLRQSSAETLVLRSGRVLAAYGDVSYRFGLRRLTSAALISQPGRPWNPGVTIPVWDAFVDDQANPALVELDADTVLVVGFAYSPRQIVGTRVSLRDFEQAPTDASQLIGRIDLAAMVRAGTATVTTDLTSTTTSPSTTGPMGAIDGRLGLATTALGSTTQLTSGTYLLEFSVPVRARQAGVALRPGENQDATVEIRRLDGTWRRVGHLDHAWRYGDVDWFSLGGSQQLTGLRVTTTTSSEVRPPNSGALPRPVAITEITLR
ncbi:sialidase family protein [Aestuariimicrobium soli]|uniref:sialidase family protein n=1 Tax=Aestuariimicrobium soli TaxID=2035834 RepID=UPI003EBCD0B7